MKIHILWLAMFFAGCEKFYQFPALSQADIDRFSATLPFMQVVYNDTALNFSIIQTIVHKSDRDSTKHAITIYGMAQAYSVVITMPGDTIPTGDFSLDSRTSSVSILSYGNHEIASLCTSCVFDLSIDPISTGVEGTFAGTLRDPYNGVNSPVRGSFKNVSSN